MPDFHLSQLFVEIHFVVVHTPFLVVASFQKSLAEVGVLEVQLDLDIGIQLDLVLEKPLRLFQGLGRDGKFPDMIKSVVGAKLAKGIAGRCFG